MSEPIGKPTTVELGKRPALTNKEELGIQAAVQQGVWACDAHWNVKHNRTRFINPDTSRQIVSSFLGLLAPKNCHLYLVVTAVRQAGRLSLCFALLTEEDTSPIVDLPRHLKIQDAQELVEKAVEQIKCIEGLIAP